MTTRTDSDRLDWIANLLERLLEATEQQNQVLDRFNECIIDDSGIYRVRSQSHTEENP